jgi:hypothetical protein
MVLGFKVQMGNRGQETGNRRRPRMTRIRQGKWVDPC